MNLDEIFESIPNVVASLYESIYVGNKESNEFYELTYTGDEIRVSPKRAYDENIYNFIGKFREDISDLFEHEEFKKILITKDNQEKLVTSLTRGSYRFIFVIDNTVKIDETDKPYLIIADDSPIISKFFTKIFRNEYNILVANDGNEAIDLVENYKNKQLLGLFLDLQMPNKNGFEVLEYFKKKNLFASVPVSIISGEDTSDGIERATTYQVIDMLQKPFSAEAARAIVEKTIRFSPKNK